MSIVKFAQDVIDQANCQTGDHGQAFGTPNDIKVILRHLWAAVVNNDEVEAVDMIIILEANAMMNEWWDGEYGYHHLGALCNALKADLDVEREAFYSLNWHAQATIASTFRPKLQAV